MKDNKDKKNPIINYFEESFQEMRKVTWPTRNQAMRLTMLVLIFCLVSAIVIGAMDAVFNYGHQKLIEIAPAATSTTDETSSALTAEAQPESQPITAEATPGTINVNGQEIPVTSN